MNLSGKKEVAKPAITFFPFPFLATIKVFPSNKPKVVMM